jgi:2-polyprenyl-3-methyl-5-hydroxy-6-metoxy-1,4-benzoquinol methylase
MRKPIISQSVLHTFKVIERHLYYARFLKKNSIIVLMAETSQIFQKIYAQGTWGRSVLPGIPGGTGAGSSVGYNKQYMAFLETFIREYDIKTIVDLGCGDWKFSRHLKWDNVSYTGIDCVAPVISGLSKEFIKENIKFECFDFGHYPNDIPNADLYIIKDVLQHWPDDLISDFLRKIISTKKMKYLLITNCHNQPVYRCCTMGDFSPLNPSMLPLNEFEPNVILKYGSKKTSLITI